MRSWYSDEKANTHFNVDPPQKKNKIGRYSGKEERERDGTLKKNEGERRAILPSLKEGVCAGMGSSK